MSPHRAITRWLDIREPSWNSGRDWPLDDKGFREKENTEIHRPRRHLISYLIKLSNFLYTFHKVMVTTKGKCDTEGCKGLAGVD